MKEIRTINREAIKWIQDCMGKKLWGVVWLSVVSAVLSLNAIAAALFYKQIVDGATRGDRHGFLLAVGCYIALLAADTLIRAANCQVSEKISFGMERTMKEKVYQRLLHAEYAEYTAWHTGEIMNYFGSDVNLVVGALLNLVPGLLSLLVTLLGSMAVLAFWNWRFCMLYVLAGLFSVAVSAGLRKKMKSLQKTVREHYDRLSVFVQETVENMTVVRAFCAEEKAAKRLAINLDGIRRARKEKNTFSNVCSTGLSVLMDLGYLFALLWCGFGILNGTVSYGTLTAVLYLVGKIQGPFANISSYIPQYYAMRTSTERLMALTGMPQENRETQEKESNLESEMLQFAEIRINNLTFSYGKKPVFAKAGLCLKRGEHVAIVGRSGAGKSTLFRLLLSLYMPQEGEISAVDARGKTILLSAATRGMFAYVPQGNFLLSGTIFDCVRFLPPSDALSAQEEEKVKKACRIACAEEFILQFPAQYQTVLGERGQGISEGQAQRLAVARALYYDAPVLLLDEATSALDEDTEGRLLENIQKLTDKTVVIVTHREKALALCDRIVRIKDGRFVEESIT